MNRVNHDNESTEFGVTILLERKWILALSELKNIIRGYDPHVQQDRRAMNQGSRFTADS
jgi:hypothetical protein